MACFYVTEKLLMQFMCFFKAYMFYNLIFSKRSQILLWRVSEFTGLTESMLAASFREVDMIRPP